MTAAPALPPSDEEDAVVDVDVDEATDLLGQLHRQRCWWAHLYGDSQHPELMAFTFVWRGLGWADVLILRGHGDGETSAYRTPVTAGGDILRPEAVCWYYVNSSALWTMRAVLTLPPAGHPDAPDTLQAAPPCCRVPDDAPKPQVIRPPVHAASGLYHG